MKLPTNWVAWTGLPRPPSGYHAAALIARLDTWSLPLSVKRGSHVFSPEGEVGWTVGLLCFYLSWGFVRDPRPICDGCLQRIEEGAYRSDEGEVFCQACHFTSGGFLG